MGDTDEDFSGITPSYAPRLAISYSTPLSTTNNLVGGLIPPPAYSNTSTPYYAPIGSGGGGGGAVDSVSAGSGLVVSPTTGAVVVSMPNVGTAGAVSNPASITTDAQGRVSAITSLGYTPVNPTALSAYAPLSGATFTGAVSGIAPTVDANLTTKLYVDNAIAGGGSGVYLPLAGGTMTGDINMSGQELTFVSKISNATGDLDLSGDDVNIRQLSAGTEELPNVLNITSAGATAIASGGAITCSAVGAVNLTSGLSTTIYSTAGSVEIGGPINHITIESNGTTVSGVSDLIASGEISGQSLDISAGALVGGGLQASTLGATNGITATGNVNLSGATSVSVPTPTLAGQATTKAYVDAKASTTPSPFISQVNSFTFTSPSSYNILDTDCVGGAIFLINTGSQLGGCPVILPASSQILPVGTTVIVQCLTTNTVLVNISEAVGGGAFRNNNIYAGGSLQCVVSSVGGPTSTPPYQLTWTCGKTFNSVSLDGTETGQGVVGPVVFEDGFGNIQCADIATALLSAVAPYNFISVEDPIQTRVLGVRSEDGSAPALIAMALSESAVAPEILEMTYNPLANDKLEVNKGMILSGGLDMSGGGGNYNIENALNIYASDTIEGQTLQAIDYVQGSANVVVKTIDPVFTNNEIAKLAYPDATAQNAVITAQGALALNDPPNGGLPAGIYINGVQQTFGGSDWSTYPATQALDMATFDIDNAGTINGINVDITGSLSAATGFVNAENVVGTVSVSGGAITSGSSVSASTTITSGGDITSTVGDINATAGNISATSGTVFGGTITALGGGLRSGGGLNLNPFGVGNTNITNAGSITATGAITGGSISAGSGTISTTGDITGATLTTTGAIKSSGTLQLSGNVISNASNNTTITGLNGITMAGTTPAITGVNSIAISNSNNTTPFTIANSGDNPHIICSSTGSSVFPVEINLVNGATVLAYGNQGTDPRGAFFFFNGRDAIRLPTSTNRLQLTYSPYSPTLATSGAGGAFVAGTGAFVSGVPKVLGTETITLSSANLPIIAGGLGTQCYIGLNGFINTCVLSGAGGGGGGSHYDVAISATYTRTRGGTTIGPFALYGCSYPVSILSGPFYSPLNGTTYNEAVVGERTTFTHGDIITITVLGLYVGGSPPSITTPASGLACVFSPFFF